MIKVGILGASGYGGGELLRWLTVHPTAQVVVATSSTYANQPVSLAFQGLAKRSNLTFVAEANADSLGACDVVFLARDNGVAMKIGPAISEAGPRLIDLSADFRFRDTSVYETWYRMNHVSPETSAGAVYGLPELHREEIRTAKIVGNPGCYTTASILALAPLVRNGLVDLDSLIVDGKSGMSGAGRSKFGPDTHFSEVNEAVNAYKIAGTHRHTAEIEQELSLLAESPVTMTFTPHTVPMTRGILATCYARLSTNVTTQELREIYLGAYSDEPFVVITDKLPSTKQTVGSNACHIALEVDSRTRRVTVVSVIDNLGKGMVGQAIQNMNLMFGLDETTGLTMPGLWP